MDKSFIRQRYAVIRNAHNISARKLSFELGQSSEYINQIENGKNLPSLENLFNFCDYFGLTLSEFFEEGAAYPVEYREIIKELNRLETSELALVSELIKLINKRKKEWQV